MESIDSLPCAYVSFGDDGVVIAANETLLSWLMISKNDLIGKSVESTFTLATRIFYNTHFFPLIKLNGSANEIFLTLRSKTGEDITVFANAVRKMKGDQFVIHCVFMQVKERRKYEDELLKAKQDAENALKDNKQLVELTKSLEQHSVELENQYRRQLTVNENLVQFSKVISHDLQEPIRKIQIFIDMIAGDAASSLSDRSKDLASRAIQASHRLKVLTTSLQQYLAIDTDKMYSRVDLNTVISAAKTKAISWRQFSDFDMEVDTMPAIDGYSNQLHLLFFHLIDNAIQFRDPARRLSIKVASVTFDENIFKVSKDRYKFQEHLRISFSDNGVGFPEQYKEYIFELLKKIESGTGVGVGLPLVKKIVSNHAGVLRVESNVGVGTRFEIELPLKLPT